MALSDATLSAITARVAARLTGSILGREASTVSVTETEIAGAAVAFCHELAPAAPEAILREASIRLAGWLYGNRPHVVEHETTDSSGTTIKLRFNNSGRDRQRLSDVWRVGASVALHRAPGRSDRLMWPFSRHTEDRQATGGYTGIISALIEAQAAGTTQQASATAATEAVAGALSRAFADARVDGPADIVEALSPRTLAQIGRDLVRVGESLHVIRMSGGRLRLFPSVHLVLARWTRTRPTGFAPPRFTDPLAARHGAYLSRPWCL